MKNKPLKIGITGGIGSGKSVVCEIFKVLGIPVYNADDKARVLMMEDQKIIKSIKRNFGVDTYFKTGELNRKFLSQNVFNDENKLKTINSIVHPSVAEDFERWSENNWNYVYIMKEAALLVESGSYKTLDFLVTIMAPKTLRIQRVLKRDQHRTEEDVRLIISKQLNDEEKMLKSQFGIINDGKSLLIPQVLKIHEYLINIVQTG
jgi:dephospho-CoA kinase